MRSAAISGVLVLGLSGACDDATAPVGRSCHVAADCASGSCLPDGTCAPLVADAGADVGTDGGTAGADAPDAGGPVGLDAGHDGPDVATSDTGARPMGCRPDHDGVVSASEAPFGPGFAAMFRVTKDVSGHSSDAACADGVCAWDLVDVDGTTTDEESLTEPLDGKWYADEPAFASATFVSKMTEFKLEIVVEVCSQVQYGVYRKDDDGLFMLGIVSEREDQDTKLVYEPPVPMLRFLFFFFD